MNQNHEKQETTVDSPIKAFNEQLKNEETRQVKEALLSDKKSENQLSVLNEYMNTIKFFRGYKKKMTPDSYLQLLKKIKYEEHKCGHPLIKIGEIGDKFFIILKGEVFIMIRRKNLTTVREYPKNWQKFKDMNLYDLDTEDNGKGVSNSIMTSSSEDMEKDSINKVLSRANPSVTESNDESEIDKGRLNAETNVQTQFTGKHGDKVVESGVQRDVVADSESGFLKSQNFSELPKGKALKLGRFGNGNKVISEEHDDINFDSGGVGSKCGKKVKFGGNGMDFKEFPENEGHTINTNTDMDQENAYMNNENYSIDAFSFNKNYNEEMGSLEYNQGNGEFELDRDNSPSFNNLNNHKKDSVTADIVIQPENFLAISKNDELKFSTTNPKESSRGRNKTILPIDMTKNTLIRQGDHFMGYDSDKVRKSGGITKCEQPKINKNYVGPGSQIFDNFQANFANALDSKIIIESIKPLEIEEPKNEIPNSGDNVKSDVFDNTDLTKTNVKGNFDSNINNVTASVDEKAKKLSKLGKQDLTCRMSNNESSLTKIGRDNRVNSMTNQLGGNENILDINKHCIDADNKIMTTINSIKTPIISKENIDSVEEKSKHPELPKSGKPIKKPNPKKKYEFTTENLIKQFPTAFQPDTTKVENAATTQRKNRYKDMVNLSVLSINAVASELADISKNSSPAKKNLTPLLLKTSDMKKHTVNEAIKHVEIKKRQSVLRAEKISNFINCNFSSANDFQKSAKLVPMGNTNFLENKFRRKSILSRNGHNDKGCTFKIEITSYKELDSEKNDSDENLNYKLNRQTKTEKEITNTDNDPNPENIIDSSLDDLDDPLINYERPSEDSFDSRKSYQLSSIHENQNEGDVSKYEIPVPNQTSPKILLGFASDANKPVEIPSSGKYTCNLGYTEQSICTSQITKKQIVKSDSSKSSNVNSDDSSQQRMKDHDTKAKKFQMDKQKRLTATLAELKSFLPLSPSKVTCNKALRVSFANVKATLTDANNTQGLQLVNSIIKTVNRLEVLEEEGDEKNENARSEKLDILEKLGIDKTGIQPSICFDKKYNKYQKKQKKSAIGGYKEMQAADTDGGLSEIEKLQMVLGNGEERYDNLVRKNQHMLGKDDQQQYLESIFVHLYIAGMYKSGESFGELALTTEAARQAMIVCSTDCEFITVSKKDFRKIMSKINETEKKKDFEFFRQFNLFTKWDDTNDLDKLSYQFKNKEYHLGEFVYKTGDQSKDLFFQKEGEIKLIKREKVDYNPLIENMTKLDKINRICNSRYEKLGYYETGIIISAPCVVGDEEFGKVIKTRTFSAVVSSATAKVLKQTRNILYQDILTKSHNFFDQLNDICTKKMIKFEELRQVSMKKQTEILEKISKEKHINTIVNEEDEDELILDNLTKMLSTQKDTRKICDLSKKTRVEMIEAFNHSTNGISFQKCAMKKSNKEVKQDFDKYFFNEEINKIKMKNKLDQANKEFMNMEDDNNLIHLSHKDMKSRDQAAFYNKKRILGSIDLDKKNRMRLLNKTGVDKYKDSKINQLESLKRIGRQDNLLCYEKSSNIVRNMSSAIMNVLNNKDICLDEKLMNLPESQIVGSQLQSMQEKSGLFHPKTIERFDDVKRLTKKMNIDEKIRGTISHDTNKQVNLKLNTVPNPKGNDTQPNTPAMGLSFKMSETMLDRKYKQKLRETQIANDYIQKYKNREITVKDPTMEKDGTTTHTNQIPKASSIRGFSNQHSTYNIHKNSHPGQKYFSAKRRTFITSFNTYEDSVNFIIKKNTKPSNITNELHKGENFNKSTVPVTTTEYGTKTHEGYLITTDRSATKNSQHMKDSQKVPLANINNNMTFPKLNLNSVFQINDLTCTYDKRFQGAKTERLDETNKNNFSKVKNLNGEGNDIGGMSSVTDRPGLSRNKSEDRQFLKRISGKLQELNEENSCRHESKRNLNDGLKKAIYSMIKPNKDKSKSKNIRKDDSSGDKSSNNVNSDTSPVSTSNRSYEIKRGLSLTRNKSQSKHYSKTGNVSKNMTGFNMPNILFNKNSSNYKLNYFTKKVKKIIDEEMINDIKKRSSIKEEQLKKGSINNISKKLSRYGSMPHSDPRHKINSSLARSGHIPTHGSNIDLILGDKDDNFGLPRNWGQGRAKQWGFDDNDLDFTNHRAFNKTKCRMQGLLDNDYERNRKKSMIINSNTKRF